MATFDQELRGRIILRSVLPLIKVLPDERPFFKKLLYKASGTVQFAARDSEQAAWVEYGDGTINVLQGRHEKPGITLTFKTLHDLNTFFAGGLALPSISGLLGLPAFVRLLPFLLKLTILLPNKLPKEPAEKALKVKLLLYMVTNALSQLNKGGDPDLTKITRPSPDRVFQWTVEGGGPAAYLRIKAGRSKAGRGTYARRRPFVHFLFPDIDGAFAVLTQQAALVEAVKAGFVRTEGALEYSKEIGFLMQRIEKIVTGG
jgi:hypothetical protein